MIAHRTNHSSNSIKRCSSHVFLLKVQHNFLDVKNLMQKPLHGPTIWKDMLKKCVERQCELAKKKAEQHKKVSSLCMDDHSCKKEELEPVGEPLRSSITDGLEMLLSGTIGRPDILWSVNKLTRSVTKWTQACDRQLARLISYIHHTSAYRQYCHVGNTAQLRRLGLFQDSDFAGDLEDSKCTSGGVPCIFGSRTFVTFS